MTSSVGTPQVTDVIVVGAGVVGLSVAVHLRWLGVAVTVLERDRVGDGTSSRGFGTVAAQSRRPHSYLRLMLAAQSYYPEFVDRLGCPGVHRVTGSITLLRDRAELDARRALIDDQQSLAGYDAGEVLDSQALHEVEPALGDAFPWGQYRAADGQVEPAALLDGLRVAAVREGADLVQGAGVQAMTHDGTVWLVTTPVGSFAAPAIVNSAGVWSGEVGKQAGLTVPVSAVRGQIVVLRSRERFLTSTIGWPGRSDIRQAEDGRVWLGTVDERDSWDLRVRAGDTAAILQRAVEIVPGLEGAAIDEAWAALRPVPADGLPLIGAQARLIGYHVAVGHGGLSFCGVEGRGLAQQIVNGQLDPLLAPFDPNRPMAGPAVAASGAPVSPDLLARAARYDMRTGATDWANVATVVERNEKATTTLARAVAAQPLRTSPPVHE